ncbi:hypothetical protein CEXT_792121 [Caerostris extrusa]|uniref:Uncharacterized protein n=1 Tax=Caerostris extrusa TaxID=172846 RepID=A0AAV4T9X3_CAEEX|nr:hypothetical protein CEXT_792121 [Caerostris extrusa]
MQVLMLTSKLPTRPREVSRNTISASSMDPKLTSDLCRRRQIHRANFGAGEISAQQIMEQILRITGRGNNVAFRADRDISSV